MEDRIEKLLSFCSEVDFGAVNLSDGEKEFCKEMNNEVIVLCKSLPESTQTDALLFFMRYFRIPFGQDLFFFMNYYVPAWSIIYWLIQYGRKDKALVRKDRHNAKIAHSMALLLHPLDDHLNDGQVPVTHMVLLLRSQSWMIMNNALSRLTVGIDGGEEIVENFLDDYYYSIRSSKEILSLDSYCNHFRKQMSTWMITPFLISKKMKSDEELAGTIQKAFESFGIAWRLLDDIKDIETDMMKGEHSSVYNCLPEEIRTLWDKDTEHKITDYTRIILDYVLENSVIERIRERICSELESAASIAYHHNIRGLADEFRCLLSPLKNRQDHL
jgi:hypothetical protein